MRLLEGTPWDRPPHCERCGKLETSCVCPPVPSPKTLIPPDKQRARISVEKRKKGKLVTIIRGLPANGNDLPGLLVRLKNSCGTGGTLAGDELELQGDQCDRVAALLQDLGYRVK